MNTYCQDRECGTDNLYQIANVLDRGKEFLKERLHSICQCLGFTTAFTYRCESQNILLTQKLTICLKHYMHNWKSSVLFVATSIQRQSLKTDDKSPIKS